MNKRFFTGVMMLMMLLVVLVPQPASAEPVITIDAKAGFEGKAKYGEGLPVRFTVTNSGSDFSGDLLVATAEGYNLNHTIALPLVLAQGETKTIQVSSPGGNDIAYLPAGMNENIFLYEGGWEDGKQVEFSGAKTLQTQFHDPASYFLATLSSNADRLTLLDGLSIPGRNHLEVFHLNDSEDVLLPTDPIAWQPIDALLVDEVAISDLSQSVQSAILEWVNQGGHLVVGSSGTVAAEMGGFAEFLPLELGEPSPRAVTPFEQDITVYDAQVAEAAESLLESDGQILAASRQVGAGAVIQTAFSLGDEGIATQEAYPAFMERLLHVPSVTQMGMGESIKNYLAMQMSSVNELFDSFNISQPFMIVVVFLYILLVVPVLYILLKRKDKREYAWVIIPVAAILTSLGIFAYGAKDRITNPQIQQIGFFEANADGGLKGYYMNSLLSNRAGDYAFTAPSGTTMTNYTSYNPISDITNSSILEQENGQSKLTLRDMRNWSVSSIIGDSYIQDAGNLAVDLNMDELQLTGSVRNNFPFALEDVSVWSGTRLLPLGDLAPGEELAVNETMRANFLAPAAPVMSQGNYYAIQTTADLKEEQRNLVMDLASEVIASESLEPMIVGYAKDGIVPAVLEDGRASVESLHLIAQKFQAGGSVTGEFELGKDAFSPAVDVTGSGYYENYTDDPYSIWFDSGQYELTYQLPEALDPALVEWSRLSVEGDYYQAEVSIFNNATEEFEPLEQDSQVYTEGIGDFVGPDGSVRFQIDMPSSAAEEISVPQIEMEGVVGQ